ncbi:Tn3 family transposase [Nitrosospira sp. Nsp18]|uniref:Tn3 family transposase n=1 Tax=Nitrosospira sp. Nsp18 TaxID=1855334 RepID=UPI001C40953E
MEQRQRFRVLRQGGEIATNWVDEQKVSVRALNLLQASLVYVNTCMLQTVLVEPKMGRPDDAVRLSTATSIPMVASISIK